MKFVEKIVMIKILFILAILAATTFSVKVSREPEGAAKSAYPNTYQPATSPEALKNFKWKIPKMSEMLREKLAYRRLRKPDFLDLFHYGHYQLTRGEAEQLFNFIDKNKDDMIDQEEWESFTILFILPFEACDENHNYLLDEKEFKYCWDKDPKTKDITYRRRHMNTYHGLIMDQITSRGKRILNFGDYVFIRKVLFGWSNCHSTNKYMSLTSFKCAIKDSFPQKYTHKYHFEKMYLVGKSLANDRNLLQIDFITYLRTTHFLYIFSILGMPHDQPVIEKSQFVKAIREDRIPNNLNEEEVEIWYKLIDATPFATNKNMNFDAFCFFYNFHRIFFKYNMEKPLQLSKPELLKAMDDPYWPEEVNQAIDSATTNFSEPQYLEVTNILERLRLNEKEFFYKSFLELENSEAKEDSKKKLTQDASATTPYFYNKTNIEQGFWDKKPNMENRKVFFDTMTTMDKRYWSQEVYYRAAILTNFFVFDHGGDDKNWLIGSTTFIEEVPKNWEMVVPVMGLNLRSNYNYYKNLPREIQIDILVYLALEQFQTKVDSHKNSSNDQINESLLKIIMKDCGMINMPDTVTDLGLKGKDILGRRVYYPKKTLINIITIQAAAGDDLRAKRRVKDFDLKKNLDPHRTFDERESSKRFYNSPQV